MFLKGGKLLRGVVPNELLRHLAALPGEVELASPLASRTTIGVGGPASCLFLPHDEGSLGETLRLCRRYEAPHLILGAGSNLLFPDAGYPGVVIVTDALRKIELVGDSVLASAGTRLPFLVSTVHRYGIHSLDFLVGIPGSVGGAVAMNAGTSAGTIGELVEEVTILAPQGEITLLDAEACRFSYRESAIRTQRLPVIGARLRMNGASYDGAQLLAARRRTQPLTAGSAGCVFKNPPHLSAGWLIEKAGLKGVRVGKAKVSEIHANFILNLGGARCAEIRKLIDIVRQKVYKSFHISLELEIEVVDG